ncbi:DUF2249 domain-containing protein [Leucobacter denitrificans]|uniref:DUF2249 domain-containing protein n=1 Tax=Leucobacter denitrificans TaxID=683042 RepID=A0A7G9S7E7_9MICO|nr:DUF2249 domain-containing protein [Leucobacter denitrificans]QNN63772.1 DUF2249 domain-containing protein [Leucobacter denitrificans]
MAHIDIHRSREEAVDQTTTGGCACGEHDEGLPELDVQTIPHAIRHASIFGAIESLLLDAGMIISATHNPLPLLQQLADRHGDAYNTKYLDEGPERWRILIRRVA